ncbi:MAG: LamB/YcsF family protein, partial [Betaproteobacteria bacterium]|nr:LamB/YcsF family protein [Betaproteobacteria bacterium]
MKRTIDLNSDMGEGFGVWEMGDDFALLDYIDSTNIACGWHAGDPERMKNLVAAAIEKNVFIGAHPSLPDLLGFGRREMAITPNDAYNYVLYQAGALQAFIYAQGGKLHHVKPHGALYNQAAKDISLARAIVQATKDLGDGIILYGLASSCFVEAAQEVGVPLWQEVFADRRYTPEGYLVPRKQANA